MSLPRISDPIDEGAFSGRKRKNHSVRSIVTSIKNTGSIEQQRLSLRDALGHPEVRAVATPIGMNTEDVRVSQYIVDNIQKVIATIYDAFKSNPNGKITSDAHTFLNVISMCVVETP